MESKQISKEEFKSLGFKIKIERLSNKRNEFNEYRGYILYEKELSNNRFIHIKHSIYSKNPYNTVRIRLYRTDSLNTLEFDNVFEGIISNINELSKFIYVLELKSRQTLIEVMQWYNKHSECKNRHLNEYTQDQIIDEAFALYEYELNLIYHSIDRVQKFFELENLLLEINVNAIKRIYITKYYKTIISFSDNLEAIHKNNRHLIDIDDTIVIEMFLKRLENFKLNRLEYQNKNLTLGTKLNNIIKQWIQKLKRII